MPQIRKGPLLVSWPNEKDIIKLDVIEEEDEPAIDIHRTAVDLMEIYWGTKVDFGEQKSVALAEIVYPERIRFYYNGKRVSLTIAHASLENGLNKALRAALDYLDKQVVDTNQEASHGQA